MGDLSDLSTLFDLPASASATPSHPLRWGAPTPAERGPVIASRDPALRNAIGAHAGGYGVYRALAIAAGTLPSNHRPDLTDTAPADLVGPHPQWTGDAKIVSLDPWGHLVGEVFREELARGLDIRPTIAVTRAHIDMPEVRAAFAAGRIRPDGDIVKASGLVRVMKAAMAKLAGQARGTSNKLAVHHHGSADAFGDRDYDEVADALCQVAMPQFSQGAGIGSGLGAIFRRCPR